MYVCVCVRGDYKRLNGYILIFFKLHIYNTHHLVKKLLIFLGSKGHMSLHVWMNLAGTQGLLKAMSEEEVARKSLRSSGI